MVNWNDYYRPKTFGDIVGNTSAVSIISRQVATGRLPKVYIFVGMGGVGKTSLARVIANELGVTDPIEINAAVNNSIDDIRALNEDANYLSFGGEMKVYILDEVHRITKPTWGASLKLMEEPPENVLFILCTTEVDKIPRTIMSRAQVFYLQPISPEDIQNRLGIICNDNDIDFDTEALAYIAKGSMGCMREAIQKLEQVSILGSITMDSVKSILPDLDIFNQILINRDFGKVRELAKNSISIDSLIKEAVTLANDNKFPKSVAIGLVKLRPYLGLPFDPEVVETYLKDSFERLENGN